MTKLMAAVLLATTTFVLLTNADPLFAFTTTFTSSKSWTRLSSFSSSTRRRRGRNELGCSNIVGAAVVQSSSTTTTTMKVVVDSSTIEEATQLLSTWDKKYSSPSPPTPHDNDTNNNNDNNNNEERDNIRKQIPDAVRLLSNVATIQRNEDSLNGRCMLGICASSKEDGIATLKSWVSELDLPRGLLHGMDVDGIPIDITGSVYIKYNTGGALTFTEMRKLNVGFESLWKPGDAMLESYDGMYRGVYFQVELSDDIFRQYLLPLDTFG